MPGPRRRPVAPPFGWRLSGSDCFWVNVPAGTYLQLCDLAFLRLGDSLVLWGDQLGRKPEICSRGNIVRNEFCVDWKWEPDGNIGYDFPLMRPICCLYGQKATIVRVFRQATSTFTILVHSAVYYLLTIQLLELEPRSPLLSSFT